MFIYQILIEYDGTNFVGWQRQKNGISIQGSIEKVLKKNVKTKSNIIWFWKNRFGSSCQ